MISVMLSITKLKNHKPLTKIISAMIFSSYLGMFSVILNVFHNFKQVPIRYLNIPIIK